LDYQKAAGKLQRPFLFGGEVKNNSLTGFDLQSVIE
jgi:hypothetical protein